MSKAAVYFSHGQEGGPSGTKIQAMAKTVRKLGCRAESVDYQGITDPTERVNKLLAEVESVSEPLILVGSSMGGHVATAAASAVDTIGLFVLAPAYFMPGYEDLTPPRVPLTIVHGWRDVVVPIENSIQFAQQCNATLHLLDGDHRLTANIDEINYYLHGFLRQLIG